MAHKYLALALSSLILQPCLAARKCETSKLCLTSFAWCEDNGKNCDVQDDMWPAYGSGGSIFSAMVLWDNKYTLSWEGADENYPVFLQWMIGSKYFDNTSLSYFQNITEGQSSFEFSFQDLAGNFPNEEFDVSPEEIGAYAAQRNNRLVISQPGRPSSRENPAQYTISDAFIVMHRDVLPYIQAQEDDTFDDVTHRWRLGVGIGVGIGVPLLMALSYFLGLKSARKGASRSVPAKSMP